MNRARLATLATAFAAGCSLAVMGSGGASAAPMAPAMYGADAGGAVIVVLSDQHTNLKLKAQGAARTSATRSDQQSIVSQIRANGGTAVRQLVSVNAVAAHVSAAEVSATRPLLVFSCEPTGTLAAAVSGTKPFVGPA